MRHARRRKVTTVALGCGEEFAVHDVSVPLGPGDAMVTAVLLSVKPGAAGTTTVKLVVALRLTAEAPATLTV